MRSIIGVEGAYVGSAHGFQSLGVTANNPTLISKGLEGNLQGTNGSGTLNTWGVGGQVGFVF
jgi:hypothetical protein